MTNPWLWRGRTVEDRLLSRVTKDVATGCWNYPAHKGQEGYGVLFADGRYRRAHRVSYALFVGPIPDGMQVHHKCENRSCVNPEHLSATAVREHLMREHSNSQHRAAVNARKTHCKHGHELTPGNCVPYLLRKGIRECLTCTHARAKRWYDARGRALREARRE